MPNKQELTRYAKAAITEAKKKIAGNLCVNTGQGSGGGFTGCNVGGSGSGGASGRSEDGPVKTIPGNGTASHVKTVRDEDAMGRTANMARALDKSLKGIEGASIINSPKAEGSSSSLGSHYQKSFTVAFGTGKSAPAVNVIATYTGDPSHGSTKTPGGNMKVTIATIGGKHDPKPSAKQLAAISKAAKNALRDG